MWWRNSTEIREWEREPVVCLFASTAGYKACSTGTASAKCVNHQHRKPFEEINPRTLCLLKLMTLCLVDVVHLTHTQMPSPMHTHTHKGWTEAPASWLPRHLITEPLTLTKEREFLHSNILIPQFTGCNGGNCRENELECVLPSASVCVCVLERNRCNMC